MKQQNKKIKFEFDTFKEYQNAMKRLEEYHDCEKCHGKIVCITRDLFGMGDTFCGYCKEKVNYPRLTQKGFDDWKKKTHLGENKK